MRNFTVDNLMFLRSQYANIYHLVRNKERNANQYVLQRSKSEEPVLLIDGSHRIHSAYDPYHEADRWIHQTRDQLEGKKHIIIFGFGLGYHIEKVLEMCPEAKLYIYEPEIEIFLAAMEARDLKNILNHENIVSIGIGAELNAFRHFQYLTLSLAKESLSLVNLPVYQKVFSEQLKLFQQEWQRAVLDYRGNLHTRFTFQEIWGRNVILNLPETLQSPPIYGLHNKGAGIPAIVVGSGPSLHQDLEYLRKCKQHALIIAAGSSIQALLKHGIQPHVVVSFDGGEANFRAFENVDLQGIPLVYSPFIHHRIVDQANTDLIHVILNFDTVSDYLMDLKQEEVRFLTTSSVTGTAIQLASYLGCHKIILVGQDLSFPNRLHYAPGIDHIEVEEQEKALKEAVVEIENVSGGKNPTTKKMLHTLQDIENLLQLYQDKNEFINTSKMGAKIKGTIWKPIEEVFQEIHTFQVEDDWFRLLIDQHLIKYSEERIRRIVNKIKQSERQLQQIQKKVERLQDKINQLEEARKWLNVAKVRQLLEDIQKSWFPIQKELLFQKIYHFFMQGHIVIFTRFLPQIQTEKDVLKKADLVNQHLGKLIKEMVRITPVLIADLQQSLRQIDTSISSNSQEAK